jgi:predicted DCC family thiol-disulfide oxidoreductase YuxK
MWRIGALALVFMRGGDTLSVDEVRSRLRGTARPPAQPRWPADLAVASLGLTLLMSGLPKAMDPTWQAGDGFYVAMLLPWTHQPWADGIAGSRAVTWIANYAGILTECGFVALVFVPKARWIAIAAFAGLMTGFGFLMSFHFIGAAGMAFLPLMIPDDRGRWPLRRTARPLELLYDGECGFCARWLRRLRAFDPAERLVPRPIQSSMQQLQSYGVDRAAALNEMHLIDGDRLYHGFDAFRRFTWTSRYLAPLAPLLHLPGIPRAGRSIYRAVAARRHQLGCSLEKRDLPQMRRTEAAPPSRLARTAVLVHAAYIVVFAAAAVLSVFGSPGALRSLNAVPPLEKYNSLTNDLRPLPLFCQVHLFGVYVYRLEGIADGRLPIELLPVFDRRGGPGTCCVRGPRYLQAIMFHVTDDVLRTASIPGYHAPAANLDLYRAAVNKAVRDAGVDVREVRMLVKLLDPPRTFQGLVAPWDHAPWTPWLRFPVQDGRVVGNLEWLERPPRPSFTARL